MNYQKPLGQKISSLSLEVFCVFILHKGGD